LARIILDASKPSFHKDDETIINLFTMLIREEEDHDVDHYKKGEKIIAFKVEASPQVEIGQ
jgi:ERCC4-related helicase